MTLSLQARVPQLSLCLVGQATSHGLQGSYRSPEILALLGTSQILPQCLQSHLPSDCIWGTWPDLWGEERSGAGSLQPTFLTVMHTSLPHGQSSRRPPSTSHPRRNGCVSSVYFVSHTQQNDPTHSGGHTLNGEGF